ncbi:MAG: division/cell wall cluster transcriptional repressor MraZ [Candidatus Omnitrophica bacterium]|nr:division/cell wall cluster transcriptional repressor MraZ [Candidatus Omnitrophota bacterium]MDD5352801.1 division/cell wall cluster transcriptional repressor MraZ [Candidatus Omnitrophota bacterium]MDD5550400.1 division/cell wall cluster transcriptional repressor MraZ [Candidatus Omnitrophota bacterium]
MFYGEYYHQLDRKGRLVLPSKIREVAKNNFVDKFFITRGLDKCLFMFSEDEWKNQEQKFKSMPFTKSETRKFNRLYFSGTTELVYDKQGRILIPQYLKDFAGINRDVVIIGVSNRIEIWSKEIWVEFYRESRDAFEEISEKLIDNL